MDISSIDMEYLWLDLNTKLNENFLTQKEKVGFTFYPGRIVA